MTARAAWQALIAARGWQRIWVPSYFCHEMTDAAIEVGAEIIVYLDDPLEDRTRLPPVADEPGEALLVVNTFGRRRPSAQSFDTAHCELIEDHTHDPLSDWARASQADWCLASLRKTLPVPVGGVTWSPKGHAVPDPPTAAAAELQVALSRLAGMVLKRIYLEGSPVQKSEFRTLLAATETGLAKLRPSAAPRWASALVDQIPVAAWREQRRENLAFLAESLARAKRLRLLSAADPSGGASRHPGCGKAAGRRARLPGSAPRAAPSPPDPWGRR